MTNVSTYPNSIDSTTTIPLATDLVSPVKSSYINALNNAIINIEQELGLSPAGIYASVRARLDAMTAAIGTGGGGGGGSGFVGISLNNALINSQITNFSFFGDVTITNSAQAHTAILTIGGSSQRVEDRYSPTNNQTSFSLSKVPATGSTVNLFVNGLKQEFGTDYTISGQTITYLGTPLITSDKVDADYLTSLSIGSATSMVVQNNSITIDTASTTLNFLSGVVTSPSTGIVDINLPTTKYVQESPSVSNNQTTFTLLQTPFDPASVSMFLNGLRLEYQVDYNVSGTTVTYMGVALVSSDEIDFTYYSSIYIAAQNSLIVQQNGLSIESAAIILNIVGGGSVTTPSTGIVDISLPVTDFIQDLPSVSNGQTAFTLTQIPIQAAYVSMFINGIRQVYGTDYVVSDTSLTYTGSVSLINTDEVVFTYYYSLVMDVDPSTSNFIQNQFTATASQTSFTLSRTPLQSFYVSMFVNGLRQEYGSDYTVLGKNITYSGPTLSNGDKITFTYYYGLVIVDSEPLVPLLVHYPMVSGEQQSGTSTFVGVGAVIFDPTAIFEGDNNITRTVTLELLAEATSGVTAECQLYNITDGAPVAGIVLSTSANDPTELSTALVVGTDIPNAKKIYEIQMRISSPGSPGADDRAILKFASLQVNYS